MGPTSFIWTGFIDPDTKLALYSIELARIQLYSEERDELYANNIQSNITFGSANDANYANADYMSMPALFNYTYAMNNFSFGRVYTTDGQDESQYFYELENWYPALFSVNFKGIGLPANLYSDFVSLFEYITLDDVQCDNTLNGICRLPAPCQNYTAY